MKMPLLDAESILERQRLFRRAVLLGAGALAASQVAVAGTLIAIDAWKHRGRQARSAPRPGTYQAQVLDSEVTVYTSGADVYDHMLEAIDNAQKTVYMETFIWKGDDMGQRFLDSFNRAAERGVEVRLIYDGFANLVVPHRFYQFSDKVQVFRLPVVRRKFWQGLLRNSGLNHSKILVVDDSIGFVGGYNIGSLYATEWRDTHMRAVGPSVWGLRNSIATVWNEDRPEVEQIPWMKPETWDPELRVYANLPIQLTYPIRGLYLSAIERATSHVWITTPYFIPDQQILEALMAAAERGVDVRVMVPKDSNHIVADWASRGFYGRMLDSGITILLYAACMIHAKTATIDGEWSTVGTANIDRLSLSFNYETNVEIIDRDFADQMETIYLKDAEHCEVLTSPEWRKRHPMARVAEVMLVPMRALL